MKKTFAVIFLVSLLLRLWFALAYWRDKPLTHDALEYLQLSKNIHEKGRFEYDKYSTTRVENFDRPPGYPYWLALLRKVQPTLGWIRMIEILISLGTTYALFRVTEYAFNVRAAFIAFAIGCFYLPLLWLIPAIVSENLWVMLILSCYLLLLMARRNAINGSPTIGLLVLAFLLLSISTLVRPGTAFALPVFLWWAYRYSILRRAALLLLLYFVVLMPWNYEQFRRHGRPVFVSLQSGHNFWVGSHPGYLGEGDIAINKKVQSDYREFHTTHYFRKPHERETLYMKAAAKNIREYPGAYLLVQLKKLFFWILPFGPSIMNSSMAHKLMSIAFYLPILFLGLLGLRRAEPEMRYFFLSIFACYAIMILLFYPQERYRIAMNDPLLIVLAAFELNARFGHRLMHQTEAARK